MAVVKLTGEIAANERISNFANGPSADNIMISRVANSNDVWFSINHENSPCNVRLTNGYVQNSWQTIVASYDFSTNIMHLQVGSDNAYSTCGSTRADRIVSFTYIGKSSWPDDPHFQGSIAGIYAVDALLGEAEISSITSKMNTGDDTLQACQTCPSNGISLQGSTLVADCTSNCPTGYSGTECTVCVDGYYAASAGVCSPMCPADTYISTDTSNVARACGPAHDENCPAYITSTWSHGGWSAPLANDGITTNGVHSGNKNANWFRIDFQEIRHLETIQYYNRDSFQLYRAENCIISVSDNSSWVASNTQCATLSDAQVQNFDCPLSGRYLFIYQNDGEYMNFAKIEAYAPTCLACPNNTMSLPGSTNASVCTLRDNNSAIINNNSTITVSCPVGQFESVSVLSNDTLCQTCPTNAVSLEGSTSETDCECMAGSYKSVNEIDPKALILVPGRVQLSTLAGRNTNVVSAATGVQGWRLVRYLPPTSPIGYSYTHHLDGIIESGPAYDYTAEWTLPFGEFDEFCFSTRNLMYWVYCTRDAAIGEHYTYQDRDVIRSSSDATPYKAKWYNDHNNHIHPWIWLQGYSGTPEDTNRLLYVAGSRDDGTSAALNGLPSISEDGGWAVWVRSSGNPPTVSTDGVQLTFDRTLEQFIDGGVHTFAIASNGGFTAVAVVKFTGAPAEGEQIFDFGNSPNNDNIMVYQDGRSTRLIFEIRNSASACVVQMSDAIVQDSWMTIVARYTSNIEQLKLRVGTEIVVRTCDTARTDRVVSRTLVGKGNWAGDPMRTITGTMYGAYVGADYPGRPGWRLKNDIYVFFLTGSSHTKMTSIPLSVVEEASQSSPASPGDRYLEASVVPENIAMLQDMWDGTYLGYNTHIQGQDVGYDVSDVVYDSWIDTPSVYTMAGLYTVDTTLSEAEISSIASKILGDTTLQTCQACPNNTSSPQGSTAVTACTSECPAGYGGTECAVCVDGHTTVRPVMQTDVHGRAMRLVAGGARLAMRTSPSTDVVDAKTLERGWRLVRFLPPTSSIGYSYTDHLDGIITDGPAYDYAAEWTVPFGEFDEFCFSTRNLMYWVYCTRDAAIGENYDWNSANADRDIIRSSYDASPHKVKWQHHLANPIHPWITLRDHRSLLDDDTNKLLYVAGSRDDSLIIIWR